MASLGRANVAGHPPGAVGTRKSGTLYGPAAPNHEPSPTEVAATRGSVPTGGTTPTEKDVSLGGMRTTVERGRATSDGPAAVTTRAPQPGSTVAKEAITARPTRDRA